MEVYNQENYNINTNGANLITKTKNWVKSALGILITILGIAVIFVIASLEGSKTIKASGSTSAKLLTMWREEHNITDQSYPEAQADIIVYEGKEYYFVIEEKDLETGEILKWHFAYDGGLDYILGDYKFYILTLLTIAISIYVARINFLSTTNKEKEEARFKASQKYYSDEKAKIKQHTQYLPAFCNYKNKQVYEDKKKEIVESADILYSDFVKEDFDIKSLEKWQKKKLKKIKKIKVIPLTTADLLQERSSAKAKIKMLPDSQETLESNYMKRSLVMKVISSALSGVVVGFGVVLGNWYLGLTYGFTVLMSAANAIAVAKDLTDTILRSRFIAKGDFLNEFYNIKDIFIKEAEEKKLIEEPIKASPEVVINNLSTNTNLEKDKTLTDNQEIITPYHTNDLIRID